MEKKIVYRMNKGIVQSFLIQTEFLNKEFKMHDILEVTQNCDYHYGASHFILRIESGVELKIWFTPEEITYQEMNEDWIEIQNLKDRVLKLERKLKS